MRTNTRRAAAVLTAVTGLLALGAVTATSAHADGRQDAGNGGPSVRKAVKDVIESTQGAVPAVPEGGGIEVPEIVPGVPSIGVLPLSLPALPVTPDLTQVPVVSELPANPADVPDMLPLP